MNVANRQPVPDLRCRLPRGGRGGFSLVELLVVVAIILVLMAMLGAAVSAARGSQRKQATQGLIARIDAIIQQHFSTYATQRVPAVVLSGTNPNTNIALTGISGTVPSSMRPNLRPAYLRRLASAEMPDSWADVVASVNDARLIASGSTGMILGGTTMTPPQRVYAGIYTTSTAAGRIPTSQFGDAECLFMIVMQSGLADCLDCGALGSSEKGDIDGDGAFEFLDAWGNPIRYVLWPAALSLPLGSGTFFSTTAPFTSGSVASSAKGGTMRPLIFSGGPDGTNAIRVNESGNLVISGSSTGMRCGDPTDSTFGLAENAGAVDNITNLDAEAAR